jgi:hypothetical protein
MQGISCKAFSALPCRLTQRQPEELSINLARLARTGGSSSTIETEIFISTRKILQGLNPLMSFAEAGTCSCDVGVAATRTAVRLLNCIVPPNPLLVIAGVIG